MIPGIAGVLAIALVLLALSRWLRIGAAVPDGKIVYEDDRRSARVLRSSACGLVGKPDYLLEIDGQVVPMEVKPGRSDGRAYPSDRLQLAAYCLLTEENSRTFGGYGILKTGGRNRRLTFTPQLRTQLINTISAMRGLMQAADAPPGHDGAARCRACGVRHACGRAYDDDAR